jgi:histidinol-phosphate aminotransferase
MEQIMSYFRSNIEKTQGYEPGFQPRAAGVVKLNTNENPYPPSPKVLEAVSNISPERLRRYPDPLANEFRQAAAQLNGLEPENIICCNGGDDLLTIVFRGICDKSRPVTYPVPTYSLYPVLARLQNCRAIEIPFDKEFNLPASLAGTGAALTIICNPNAPSGSFVNIDELASLADEISGVLLIDEAYVDFAQDNAVSLVKEFDNVIILRSMSKGYSLAGIRFGYAMACKELIDGLMKVKDSYNVDTIAAAAAVAAIKDQNNFKENIKKIKADRETLTNALREIGFEVSDSFANFVLAKNKDSRAGEIYDKLVQHNIFVRYFNVPGLDDKLRITVGTREQNDKFLSALKEII